MKCMEMIYVLPHKRISNDVIEERTTNEISEIQVEPVIMEMIARIWMEAHEDGDAGKIAG